MSSNQSPFTQAKDIVDEAYRTGAVTKWIVDVVRQADTFKYISGSLQSIVHEPNILASEEERGNIVAAYSIVRLASGQELIEVMPRHDLDLAREQSRATGPKSPWVLWHGEMCKKAVLKRHAKRFGTPDTLAAMIQADHDAEGAARPIRHDAPTTGSSAEPAELVICDAEVAAQEVATGDARTITTAMRSRLFAIARKVHGDGCEEVVRRALGSMGYESTKDVTRKDYESIVTYVENSQPEPLDEVLPDDPQPSA